MSKSLIILLLILLVGCSFSNEKKRLDDSNDIGEYDLITHEFLDHSTLQIPIDYPVNDLQTMMNRIMPDTLVNDSIDLNDKDDYLILKVMPIGQLLLNSYQNYLDASIPVKAFVYVHKKVAAFNIKNKKPVEFKLRLDLHTELAIDETFNLNTVCSIQKIQWIEEPKLRLMGIKVNLKKKITQQLEKNAGTIESSICEAIDNSVHIQKEVLAIWNLLNKTHRVAKKPIDIWLTTTPRNFSAQFEKEIKDTLRVMLYARTGIMITPLKGISTDKVEDLPTNQQIVDNNELDLFVSVNMPYEYMDAIMNSQLEGQSVSYAGLSTALTGFKTTSKDERLKLECKATGDVNVNLIALTKPSLNEELELIFEDISYTIDSKNPLVNSIEWLSNSSVDEYLRDNSKVQLAHILDSLDVKIVTALDRSNLGSKIDLKLNFSNIQSDTVIYHNDRFEWLFSIDGKAHAFLSDSLVEKKM